jgi:succinyl-diaminopimelate desuccinylase
MLSTDEQAALAQIDDDQLIHWVQELTRIPSVWRPESGEGEAAAARWVADRCHALGLETHVEEVVPGRPNVVARLRLGGGTAGGPTLLFEGHTDVVTEGNPALWTDPPFAAVLRDGRVYGRGANDMKAGLVCALAALGAIARSGVRRPGALMLAAVCDEEGQMLGIKHFVAQGWAKEVGAAIVCEPEENHLCIEQKGVMWLRARIDGVMAHGAMPLSGANTAYPAARFLTLVEELEARTIADAPPSRFLGQPSLTPTIVQSPPPGHGEPQNNVMPGATEVVLDCRLVPGQDADALRAAVETLLHTVTAGDPRLRYTLDTLEVRPPTATGPQHPVVACLASAYTDLTGTAPVYGGVPGSTDGTILHTQAGVPIVTCGPGDIQIPHHIDEWVSVDEIKLAARLYVLAALRFLEG